MTASVLIVQNNDTLNRAISASFASEGMEILVAKTAIQAAKLCRESSLSAIVFDPELPGISGAAAMSLLGDNLENKRPAVLLVQDGTDLSQELHRLGTIASTRIVQKPADAELIITTLRSVLEQADSTSMEARPSSAFTRADPVALAELFVRLADRAESGILTLRHGRVERQVLFYSGMLGGVRSNQRADSLGQILVRCGWLDGEELQAIQERTMEGTRRLGELIDSDDLPAGRSRWDALSLQLHEVVSSCFAWESFSYEFRSVEGGAGMPSLACFDNPAFAVADGFRRFVSLPIVDQVIQRLGDEPMGQTDRMLDFETTLIEAFGKSVIHQVLLRRGPLVKVISAADDAELCMRAAAAMLAIGCATGSELEPGKSPRPAQGSDDDRLRMEHKRLMSLDYFDVLGVSAGATPSVVQDSYERLLGRFEPAQYQDAELRDMCVEIRFHLAEARRTLASSDLRTAYCEARGIAPLSQGNRVEARRQYLEADRCVRDAERAWKRGDPAVAVSELLRAIHLRPREADFYARLGWYTYHREDIDRDERRRLAIGHLEEALAINPSDPYARYYQGRIHLEEGNRDRARIEFEAALRADPGFQQAREALTKLRKRVAARTKANIRWPAETKPRRRRIVVLVAAVCACVLAGYYVASLQPDGDATVSVSVEELATDLPLSSAQQAGATLIVETDRSWRALSDEARRRKVRHLVSRSARLGMNSVIVYLDGVVVADADSEQIQLMP